MANEDPKVLLVDDNETNLIVLRGMIKSLPIQIFTADSGQAALNILKEHRFAVILMDVMMPQMDGFETARRMQEDAEHEPTPIIYVTANTMDSEFEHRAYESGAVDFLHKPLNHHVVLSKVRVFIELYNLRREAEKSRDLKSEFLASMSHEIRTPMNGVIGMLGLVRNTQLEDQQKEWIDTAINSADTLMQIINDILDFSKIEADKIEFEEIAFDFRQLMNEAVQLMSVNAKSKAIELNLDYAEELPQYFNGDPGRIKQILFNLISNAIKFTDKGNVAVKVELTSTDEETSNFLVSVTDSGIGIPEDKWDYIFEKFNQADASTTRKFGGTGLGLAICKQLVNLMKGEISVTSVVGEGSTFSFTLPLTSCNKDSVKSNIRDIDLSKVEQSSFEGTKTLLVEDNRVNQMITVTLLESIGCEVSCALNGIEALDVMSKDQFDIVFMDCMMPEMDGYEATEALRQIESGLGKERTPVIALTANAMRGEKKKCINAGMDDYLSKPVKKEALIAILLKYSKKLSEQK